MLARFSTGCLLCLPALLLFIGSALRADDPPATESEADAAKKFQSYARETAARYEAQMGREGGRKLTLRVEPILRWTNPLGGRKAHGEVFVWNDRGRPAAVLSTYEFTDATGVVREHHEFSSLALDGLHFSSQRPTVWTPTKAGVEPQPLPSAPRPAMSSRQRLSQMRELAARFTAEKTTRQDETRTLRLLSQPVCRYESERAEDSAVLDGAMFAFVEATDPEIFLLIEARQADGRFAWHFAVARMNSTRLQVSLDEKSVWERDVLPWKNALNRSDAVYTAFQIR